MSLCVWQFLLGAKMTDDIISDPAAALTQYTETSDREVMELVTGMTMPQLIFALSALWPPPDVSYPGRHTGSPFYDLWAQSSDIDGR